jgi:sugar transferase (PEP-CTERM/EpsH1 system associated)
MAKILFLAHRVPFPPDKGDKIRAYNFLRSLAARHQIWLGAGADDLDDLQHRALAKELCRDVLFAPLGPRRRGWNLARALATGAPLSTERFHHPGLARWVDEVIARDPPDVVFIYSSAMAQYVSGPAARPLRVVIDFVDADAAKWRAYARKAPLGLRSVYRREFRRLVNFDRRALSAAECGVVVSETERRLLTEFLPEGGSKIQIVPNGVDVDYFAPTPGRGDGRSIVFCGRMDYAPNVDAAQWFARQVLPLVRHRRPDAVFRIVGAAPVPAVRALAELPGVEVTAAVPDVRPYLARAAVVVAPLRIARGVQNKVLEALAAARPLVATPEALDGVEAAVGRDVLTADGAERFAAAVDLVLGGHAPGELAVNGRAFVLRHHQWSAQTAALERILFPAAA